MGTTETVAVEPAAIPYVTPVPHRDALTPLDLAVDAVVGLALLGELIVVMANVIGRWLLDIPLLWADEVAGFSLSVIAFLGGAIAYRREQHVLVRTVVDLLPTRWRLASYALVDWLVLEIALIAGYQSFGLLIFRWEEVTPILEMSAAWIAVPLTLSMIVLAIYAVGRLSGQTRASILWSGIALAVVTAAIVGARYALGPIPATTNVSIAIAAVLVTVLMGLPIAFALMMGTVLFLYLGGIVAMVALPQNMVDGTGRFVLLALPFFIFAGIVMERGGISRRLIVFVAALVGGLRGGLLQVMVVSMYIVSGISGSKAADVAAVGLVMRDMLKKEKYDVDQSAALLAASAAMGECIPPSLAMLVLGSVTSLSVASLFAAGLIPAAVIAAILMLLIWVQSPRRSAVRIGGRGMSRLGLGALIPFSMPVLLFAGILLGFATPTEVSAFAVAYGLLIAAVVYREMKPGDFRRMVAEASTSSGMVLFTLAAAQSFSWVLSAAELPHRLAELVPIYATGPALFLLASIVTLIVLGSLLEGLPAILILAPLLVPLAPAAGVDPLHYGIVLLVAMGIGAFLPPLGVGFYIACSVVRAHADRATRAMAPYFTVLIVGVLVVAYVPWFTLLLPRLMHLVK
jgi:tripartite ATP-independent transporter DctM subunit